MESCSKRVNLMSKIRIEAKKRNTIINRALAETIIKFAGEVYSVASFKKALADSGLFIPSCWLDRKNMFLKSILEECKADIPQDMDVRVSDCTEKIINLPGLTIANTESGNLDQCGDDEDSLNHLYNPNNVQRLEDSCINSRNESNGIEFIHSEPSFLRGYRTLLSAACKKRYKEINTGPCSLSDTIHGSAYALRMFRKNNNNFIGEDPNDENSPSHLLKEMKDSLKEKFVSADRTIKGKSDKFPRSTKRGINPPKENALLMERHSLPVYKLRGAFIEAVTKNQVLIVNGETGSGKSTQLTQYLAEAGFAVRGTIGCTQPRRVAAVNLAKRVAEEFGCETGQEVGYTIRFKNCSGPKTIIKYITEGTLLQEIVNDPVLTKYSVIMLDEAHERSINIDILFGLLKEAISLRPDLRLIITSATLDSKKFSEYFVNAPVLKIPGRKFDVEILYMKNSPEDYIKSSLMTVMQIHVQEAPGDILLFLTGEDEIERACKGLRSYSSLLGADFPRLEIIPLYSALTPEEQSRVFLPAPSNSRKVVVSTNIAETSLTIDGIVYVVDPGFAKQKKFNEFFQMDNLNVIPISQAAAGQRSGRAGRTGPGKCYRLYTQEAFLQEMKPNTIPEIQRSNVELYVLRLKCMGINDLYNFDFMDAPSVESLTVALASLHSVGALDDKGIVTSLGQKMSIFPLEASLTKILLVSVKLGVCSEILTIISMLTQENILIRPRDQNELEYQIKKNNLFRSRNDHIGLLNVYNAWKENNYSTEWCSDMINVNSLQNAAQVRQQLEELMKKLKYDVEASDTDSFDDKETRILKAVCCGLFKNVAKRRGGTPLYDALEDDHTAYIHPSSAQFFDAPKWVVFHTEVSSSKLYMRGVSKIDPKWLVECAPAFYRFRDEPEEDNHNGWF